VEIPLLDHVLIGNPEDDPLAKGFYSFREASRPSAPPSSAIYGLITHHRARGAIVITSGHFTQEAKGFAAGKPIGLLDGTALLQLIKAVQTNRIPAAAYIRPSPTSASTVAPLSMPPGCPTCGSRMVQRVARKGATAGNSFWGCSNFPTCRGVRNV
jgi:restriction system protein